MSFLRTETKILTEFDVILKDGKTPDFTTDKEIEKFILKEMEKDNFKERFQAYCSCKPCPKFQLWKWRNRLYKKRQFNNCKKFGELYENKVQG